MYKFKDKSGAKVFVNVVMHELVQKPLDASMQEVSDEHLDNRGIANLRVPLDVGDPFSTPDKYVPPYLSPCAFDGTLFCANTTKENVRQKR